MSIDVHSTTPDCEIVSTRIFNASRELLFKAWTDPNHLKKLVKPAGFTNSFYEFDLRPGGRWRFMMHGPGGKGNYPNEVEFIKIEKPTLIYWKRISQPFFNVLATFEEVAGNNTRVIFRQIFNTAKECNKVKPFAVEKNEENFDRLENELTKMIL